MFTRPTPVTHSTNSSHSLDRLQWFTFKTAPSSQQVYTFKALRNKHYGNSLRLVREPQRGRGIGRKRAASPSVAQRQSEHGAIILSGTRTQFAQLREGREVHIEGLGYFSPTLEATQKVTRKTKNKHLKLRLKGVSFRPDIRLKAALAGVTATQSKYTRHSLRLSEVEIDMRLKEYFTEHELLLRIDFQELCGMARTTANNHLQRLQKEGKLTNVGRRAQPIYRPMPGYYGMSRDAELKR